MLLLLFLHTSMIVYLNPLAAKWLSCFLNSIGRVNPELYALSTGTWVNQRMDTNACTSQNDLESWMRRYAEVLCVNCWQVI
jgi:hypothetical protein